MAKIRVYHRMYGCETGCCGHVIEVNGETDIYQFDFGHPYSSAKTPEERERDFKRYAEDLIESELGPEHVKDLDWESCEVSDS